MVSALRKSPRVIGAARLLICSGRDSREGEMALKLALSNRPDITWTLSFDSYRQCA